MKMRLAATATAVGMAAAATLLAAGPANAYVDNGHFCRAPIVISGVSFQPCMDASGSNTLNPYLEFTGGKYGVVICIETLDVSTNSVVAGTQNCDHTSVASPFWGGTSNPGPGEYVAAAFVQTGGSGGGESPVSIILASNPN